MTQEVKLANKGVMNQVYLGQQNSFVIFWLAIKNQNDLYNF